MVSLTVRRPGSPVGQSKEHLISNSTRHWRVLLVFGDGLSILALSVGSRRDPCMTEQSMTLSRL
jgi:hypothetical protein